MFIFSRPKKYVVDFVTNDFKTYEYFPIEKSNRFIPDWWKNIPEQYSNDVFKTKGNTLNTLKRCPGFLDVYKHSYTLPLWTECEIIIDKDINEDGYSVMASDGTGITSHPSFQAGKFMSSNSLIHFKFHSPWMGYSTKRKDLLWNWSPAVWNNPKLLNDLFVPTAFRNFRGGSGTNIHTFMDSSTNTVLNIDAGTPMIHMVPMTDCKVEVKCHYDPDWYNKIYSITPQMFSNTNSYYTKRRLLNRDRGL